MSRTDGVFVIGIEGTDYHRVGYLEGASQTLEKLVGLVQESVPGKVVVDKWLPGEHEADAARLAKEMLSAGGKETATGWIEGSKGLVASITEFHNPCHAPDGKFCPTPSGGGVGGKKKGAGWKVDPTGKNAYRYYDGSRFTENVQTKKGAEPSKDPLPVTEGSSEKAPPSGGFIKPPPGTVKTDHGEIVSAQKAKTLKDEASAKDALARKKKGLDEKPGVGGIPNKDARAPKQKGVLGRLIAELHARKAEKNAKALAKKEHLRKRVQEIQAKMDKRNAPKEVKPGSSADIKRRVAAGELRKTWYGGRVIKKGEGK